MSIMRKDSARLLQKLRKAGCEIVTLGSGHHMVKCPEGALVVLSGSPSDPRSHANAVARLRRAGVSL